MLGNQSQYLELPSERLGTQGRDGFLEVCPSYCSEIIATSARTVLVLSGAISERMPEEGMTSAAWAQEQPRLLERFKDSYTGSFCGNCWEVRSCSCN